MNFLPLGLGLMPAAWPEGLRDINPEAYPVEGGAQALATMLAPFIQIERQERREAERASYLADPEAAAREGVLSAGLLGNSGLIAGRDYFRADGMAWFELLRDVQVLERIGRAMHMGENAEMGMSPGLLAQAIAQLLRPPNWELYFWMGRALESVPIATAIGWSADAANVARAEAEAAEKSRATSKGRALADAAWAQAREQRAWWEREWAQAKAANGKLSKKAFVQRHWLAYLALDPKPRYTEDTVATKWLRGK